MIATNNHHQFPWLLIAITTLGFALRIDHISAQALSGDEAFTVVNWASGTVQNLLTNIAKIDPQPPIALLSYYAWLNSIGNSEVAGRLLSALSSVIAIPVVAMLTVPLFNRRVALMASLLTAINPFLIAAAQDIRPYALWITLSLLTAYVAHKTIQRNDQRDFTWLHYAILATISIFTFYLDAFFIVAHNLHALTHFSNKTKQWLLKWISAHFIVATCLALWFAFGGFQNSAYKPTAASSPDILTALLNLTFGATYPYQDALKISIPILLGISLFAVITSGSKSSALFLAAHIIAPITLLATLSLITHQGYFRARYIGAAVPYILILIAAALEFGLLQFRHRIAPIAALSGYVILATITTANANYNPTYAKAPVWPELMAFLDTETHPNDLVIQNYPDPAFTYYYRSSTPTIILPTTANPSLAETTREVASVDASINTIWFLATPSPAWDKDQIAHQLIDQHLQPISERQIGIFHLFQYGQWFPSRTAIANPTAVEFQSLARFDGFSLTPTQISYRPGDTITLQVFLTPTFPTQTNLTLFVHLITTTPQLSLIAQDDHPPQHGRITTRTWRTNTLLRDVATITIPAATKPGAYLLTLGFYDPKTNSRIPIITNTAQPENSASFVTNITIQSK